jgi:aspartate/methionine/tyrosine aminotransferase
MLGMTRTRTSTLTSNEEIALAQDFGFADGHAYHDLDDSQRAVVMALPDIWQRAAHRKHVEIEREFAAAFYELAKQPSRLFDPRFRICTTASQSIDLVARFLAQYQLRVGLVEPTFDNLALIIKRWNVPLASIAFNDLLCSEALAAASCEIDALFLVLPNNPTGENLNYEQFRAVVDYCRIARKLLVIDFCFRFFAPINGDFFEIMESAGIDYICVEDTGKTWPTLDMKASLLAYSSRIASALEDIYAEIFLCVSPFVLSVLTSFIQAKDPGEVLNDLWELVDARQERVRSALQGTRFRSLSIANNARLPVAWIDIGSSGKSDFEVVRVLQERGIACLPGRHFYWNSHGSRGHDRIRLALFKTAHVFDFGMERLAKLLRHHYPDVASDT